MATGFSEENRLPGLSFFWVNARFRRRGLTGASDIFFGANQWSLYIIIYAGHKIKINHIEDFTGF